MRLKGRQPSWSKSSKTYWVYNLSKAAYKISVFLFWSPFTVLALGTLRPMVKLPLTEMGKKQALSQKDKHIQSLSLLISYCWGEIFVFFFGFLYHKFPRCILGWLLSNLVSTHSIGKYSSLVVTRCCFSVKQQEYSLSPLDGASFGWTLV